MFAQSRCSGNPGAGVLPGNPRGPDIGILSDLFTLP